MVVTPWFVPIETAVVFLERTKVLRVLAPWWDIGKGGKWKNRVMRSHGKA
jgi:hypothetical protein